jgi:hypothetical protein
MNISHQGARGQRFPGLMLTPPRALTTAAAGRHAGLDWAGRRGFNGCMDEVAVKTAVDRFVRDFSFTARRELEKSVRQALANGSLQDGEQFTAGLSLSSDKLDLDVTLFSKIEL